MKLPQLHKIISGWLRPKAAPSPQPATDLYGILDARHSLQGHGVDREFFYSNPDHNALWIPLFFDNRALFQGRVNLRFFLSNGSAELFKALLGDGNWQDSLADNARTIKGGQAKPRYRPKRPHDGLFSKRDHMPVVRVSDGKFIQPIRAYHPLSKYRINGGGK